MVPRARMTQRWPLRPWRSQRKMYVVIYRGALRRRIRRLVRSRVFNNARTATRNLDLPLAIGDPIATQLFLLHRRILDSAWRQQWRVFLGPVFGPKLRNEIELAGIRWQGRLRARTTGCSSLFADDAPLDYFSGLAPMYTVTPAARYEARC